MKLLITGGAGFIGSNFIRYLLTESEQQIELVNLDLLTYAGNLDNLRDVENHPGYSFIRGDIADQTLVDAILAQDVDAVVNFAAESHVDRSIDNPAPFFQTNVLGTQVLLESARRHKVKRLIQVSTDEVYGSLDAEGYFTEESPLNPSSPYAASKAGADLLASSYFHTYGLPVIITRCCNNYGPYQYPEKLIPLFITRALESRPLPLYGDGRNVRDWIYVLDHCRALNLILSRGKLGRIYNIGSGNERTNLKITAEILKLLGRPPSLIRFVADRPGHDQRYAIDASRLRRELDWQPAFTFSRGMKETVNWYRENTGWWHNITQ